MSLVSVVIFLISGVSLVPSFCKPTSEVGGAKADSRTVMRCKGNNLTLHEPDIGVTVLFASVFKGEETLANSLTAAAGKFQDRLTVEMDGRVTLSNLTPDDFGKYRVEVKQSKDREIQRSLKLVISEPPETRDGTLLVTKIPTSGDNSVRLTCGSFTSLGFPPVSVIWKDPRGDILPSDGFEDQVFYLDLPLSSAVSGDYCCQLDCHAPDYCCLDQQSSLRQCAPLHVQTDMVDSFTHLQQQVLDLVTARMSQSLEKFRVQVTSDVSNAVERLETNANNSREALQWRLEDLGHKMKSGFCKSMNNSSEIKLQDNVTNNNQSLVFLPQTTQSPINSYCLRKEGYKLLNRRCIKISKDFVDYQTAKANCLSEEAHLLILKSRDVDAWVLRDIMRAIGIFLPYSPKLLVFWVGADDISTEGSFVWNDGSPLLTSSPLWQKDEPNDLESNEDCVQMCITRHLLTLNDNNCGKKFQYVCEYKPPELVNPKPWITSLAQSLMKHVNQSNSLYNN